MKTELYTPNWITADYCRGAGAPANTESEIRNLLKDRDIKLLRPDVSQWIVKKVIEIETIPIR